MVAAVIRWLALPVAAGMWPDRAGLPRPWLAAALCLLDAAVLAVCGLLCLALLAPPVSEGSIASDDYIWLNPGRAVLVWAAQLLGLTAMVTLVGQARFLGAGRLGLGLFGLIHIAIGLAVLPRLLWRIGIIEAGGMALSLELGGSQLNVMLLPATYLALAAAALSLLWRGP